MYCLTPQLRIFSSYGDIFRKERKKSKHLISHNNSTLRRVSVFSLIEQTRGRSSNNTNNLSVDLYIHQTSQCLWWTRGNQSPHILEGPPGRLGLLDHQPTKIFPAIITSEQIKMIKSETWGLFNQNELRTFTVIFCPSL